MRRLKFRAWAKKTHDHYISDPIDIAFEEFSNIEPKNSQSVEWDEWYSSRDRRVKELSDMLNQNASDRYEITYEMIDDFGVKGNGNFTKPYRCELIDVMQFVGIKDKNEIEIYEGDIIKGKEWSKGISHRHIGVVTYIGSSFKSVGVKQYYGYHGSVDGTYEIIGNIHENPELIT